MCLFFLILRTKHIRLCAQPNIPRKKRRNNAGSTVSSLCFSLVFKSFFVCSYLARVFATLCFSLVFKSLFVCSYLVRVFAILCFSLVFKSFSVCSYLVRVFASLRFSLDFKPLLGFSHFIQAHATRCFRNAPKALSSVHSSCDKATVKRNTANSPSFCASIASPKCVRTSCTIASPSPVPPSVWEVSAL